MRVLIVEDEWLLAGHVAEVVREAGHDVVAMARREAEALSAAEAHRPDVAIMDLRLADGDCGVEVARKLLERFGIRCVFTSGNIDLKKDKIREFDPSPLGLLHKPVMDNQLLEALRRAERAAAEAQQAEPQLPERAAAKPETK